MPSIADSSRMDRGRIQAVATPIVRTGGELSAPPEESPTSPFFRSSLPPMAASFDLYHRQFRSTTTLTTTRILPVNL